MSDIVASDRTATLSPDKTTNLDFEGATASMLLELFGERVADDLDDLFFVFKVDLFLRRVHVDIHLCRIDLQSQVDERVRPFWQEARVEAVEGTTDGPRFDEAICVNASASRVSSK